MSRAYAQLVEGGLLHPLHRALADLVRRIDGRHDEDVALAAAVASDQVHRGHVCFDLTEVDRIVFAGEDDERQLTADQWPAPETWTATLSESAAVAARSAADDSGRVDRPLVIDLDRKRVYLARYWFYQQRLAACIADRVAAPPLDLDEAALADGIHRLFPRRGEAGDREQCLASANAVDQRLSVITGGPGTGKTTTVARLLALRWGLVPDGAAAPRVVLAAPTGKAAARLGESLARTADHIDADPALRRRLSEIRTSTIHRALRWTPVPPERGGPFTHDADFPIDADLVVVDEASMVDLGLMWRLFDAVRPDAQIVLMGDRDQLASVEAGVVLGDLCIAPEPVDVRGMSESRRRLLQARTGVELPDVEPSGAPLADHVVNLPVSRRFDPSGPLGRLAQQVRAGRADDVVEALREPGSQSIRWIEPANPDAAVDSVVDRCLRLVEPLSDAMRTHPAGDAETLRALNQFRILCAHRFGPLGATQVNRRVTARLTSAEAIDLHPGCPVMVTANQERLGLFNGDTGVAVEDDGGALDVLFEDASGPDGLRRVPAVLIGRCEASYAMTIHKSQGSQFHDVTVVLPPRPSPILSRELLYTAITRVADVADTPGHLTVIATESVLRTTVRNRIRRTSGLSDALDAQRNS